MPLSSRDPERSRKIAALTFDEDKLTLAVGRAREGRLATLDFVEQTESAGLRGGTVADAAAFADALDRLVTSLERVSATQPLDRIVCGVHGSFIEIQFLTRSCELPPGGPLTDDDVARLVHDTARRAADDRALLQVLPWRFVLDEYRETDNPVGLRGDVLGIEALGIYAQSAPYADYQDVFDELGLTGAELVLGSVAAAPFALTDYERRQGTAHLEIAWDASRLSVFSDRRLYYHRSIEPGFSALASALALEVPMTPDEARRRVPTMPVSPAGDPLSRIVADFIDDTLQAARRALDNTWAGLEHPPTIGGWVIAGVPAEAPGATERAERVARTSVRRARVPDAFAPAAHDDSTLVGLLGLLDCAAAGVPASGSVRARVRGVRDWPRRVWERLRVT